MTHRTRQPRLLTHMQLNAEAPEEAVAIGLHLLRVGRATSHWGCSKENWHAKHTKARPLTCILSPTSRSAFSSSSQWNLDLPCVPQLRGIREDHGTNVHTRDM